MSESQETSDYPGALDSWVTLTDKEDLAEASDLNKLKAAMLATQTELGADVAGSVVNLVTRLARALADSGAIANGTSFPVSPAPIDGQIFYRTDEDKLYVYNGSSWLANAAPSEQFIQSASFSAASSITITETISAGDVYKLVIEGTPDLNTADFDGALRINGSSSGNYQWNWWGKQNNTTTLTDISATGSGDTEIEFDDLLYQESGGNQLGSFKLVAYITARASRTQIDWELNIYKESIQRKTFGSSQYVAGTPTSINIVRLAGTATITGRWYLYKLLSA